MLFLGKQRLQSLGIYLRVELEFKVLVAHVPAVGKVRFAFWPGDLKVGQMPDEILEMEVGYRLLRWDAPEGSCAPQLTFDLQREQHLPPKIFPGAMPFGHSQAQPPPHPGRILPGELLKPSLHRFLQ